ncbi:DEAD/DEAH box helicase [Butyrivibrio sp. AC2005]|uniref:DEAD/DEAH box helicase n=1 Tax=Butyrivibrio sp. AC2005 TaxID=1280672 RepID=UPI00042846DC|nr:DEAD/DEAH box helicase [Butyrivibrio sp. AC2005]
MNLKIYKRANEILKEIYGAEATFREGQYEAIESVLTRKRTVVVQKTGWGKSLVYFVASRMISELRGGSITIIISPLLVLMDNQRILAENAGLKCAMQKCIRIDRN